MSELFLTQSNRTPSRYNHECSLDISFGVFFGNESVDGAEEFEEVDHHLYSSLICKQDKDKDTEWRCDKIPTSTLLLLWQNTNKYPATIMACIFIL